MIDMPRRQRAGLFSMRIIRTSLSSPHQRDPGERRKGYFALCSILPLALIDYYEPDSGFIRRVAEKRSRPAQPQLKPVMASVPRAACHRTSLFWNQKRFKHAEPTDACHRRDG